MSTHARMYFSTLVCACHGTYRTNQPNTAEQANSGQQGGLLLRRNLFKKRDGSLYGVGDLKVCVLLSPVINGKTPCGAGTTGLQSTGTPSKFCVAAVFRSFYSCFDFLSGGQRPETARSVVPVNGLRRLHEEMVSERIE